jgi:hypothetical protein
MRDMKSPETNIDPQLDEAVWNVWVKKNEDRDKIRLARRKWILAILSPVAAASLLAWLFIR